MLISETQILEVLRRQNHWWQRGKVSDDLAPPFKRLAFYEVQTFLHHPELKRAVLLSGARRVGKTVLLHQLAQAAIERGTPPKKILYVTFEDLTLTQASLNEILNLYEKNVETIDEQTLILMDEIHYTTEWSRALMTALRDYPRARMAATGSAAVLLRDTKQHESGVGRWTSVHVPTLSFYEYVHLRELRPPTLPATLTLESLVGLDARGREAIVSACLPLQREFNRYLLQGGFPAFVSEKVSLGMAQRLLREDVLDKALKRDMAHLYGARRLGQIDQIFVYLCFNSGGIVEKSTLAKEMQHVSAGTVEHHLRRLEDAHLIYRLPSAKLTGKKSLKPRQKIYVADPSLRNAVILRGDGLFQHEAELGALIEGCVYKHLYAFYYPEQPRFGYWRSPRGDKEVDVIAAFPDGRQLAVEVKYRQNPHLGVKEGLMELVRSAVAPAQALLVTRNPQDFGPDDTERAIFRIPAFVFTYLLGHIELQRWSPPASYGQDSQPLSRDAAERTPKTEEPS
ncbi:MAG: ATP-binding protein [Candidatus Omnitrophica bacterium]|nr:ATP-binding protein [Candidatus Omnitrophota bacterium]